MKESGIDWIGQIPQEWEVSRLKYFFDIYAGGDIDERNTVDEYSENHPYPVISNSLENEGILGYTNNFRFQGDSVTVTGRGDVGKAVYRNIEFYPVVRLLVCIPKKQVDCRFVTYWINSAIIEKNQTAVSQLTIQMLGELIFTKVPYVEQKKIADFLDKKTAQLDKVKVILEEQIQKLKDYRASLIYETVTKGLDKTVPMKDSGIDWIGQVPQGWGVSKLKFILEKGSNSIKVGPFGSSLSGDAIRSSGKWVYNQRNVLDNNFTETDFYISEAKCKELKNFSVSSGDILLTTRGTIGRVAIVPKKYCEGIIHPCLMKFKVDSRIVLPELIKYLFNDIPLVREQLNFLSNSTTIDVIYSYNLKNIIIPTIPIEEQYSILEVLDRQTSDVDALIKIKQKQIENINKQRQTLIYDYVTGKRRV